MARHPGTSNSGKPIPAPGLTRASSQNNVTDVQCDVHSLERPEAGQEATSDRCEAGEELLPARPWPGSPWEFFHLPPSDFLFVHYWSTTTRRQMARDARKISMLRPALSPSPCPHMQQRSADMDLERLITASTGLLKY